MKEWKGQKMNEIDKRMDEIGYKKIEDDERSLEYEKYKEGEDEYICFYKDRHKVTKQWCMEAASMTMDELQAIYDTCQNLGWLEPNEEHDFLKVYRELRKIYPKDDLIICNPKTMFGYNVETKQGIELSWKPVEVHNDN